MLNSMKKNLTFSISLLFLCSSLVGQSIWEPKVLEARCDSVAGTFNIDFALYSSGQLTFTRNDSIIYQLNTAASSVLSNYNCGCQPNDTIRMYASGLRQLYIKNTDITAFEVFNSDTYLQVLYVHNSRVTHADVSHFTRLRSLEFKNSVYPMERIILDSANIKSMGIVGVGSPKIDLRYQKNLEIYSYNSSHDTKQDTLDYTGCTGIKHLFINSGCGHIILPEAKDVEQISIKSTRMDTLVIPAIDTLRNLSVLDLTLRYVDFSACYGLVSSLVDAPTIDSIVMGYHPLLKDFIVGAKSLPVVDMTGCPNLKHLDVSDAEVEQIYFHEDADSMYVNLLNNRFKVSTLPDNMTGNYYTWGRQYPQFGVVNGTLDLSGEKYYTNLQGAVCAVDFVFYKTNVPLNKNKLIEGKDYVEDEGKFYFSRPFVGDSALYLEYTLTDWGNLGQPPFKDSPYYYGQNPIFRLDSISIPTAYVPTGIEEVVAAAPLSFFPNPASTVLYWVESAVGLPFRILSLSGMLLKEGVCEGELSVSNLQPGQYMVGIMRHDTWEWEKMTVK